MKYQSLAEVRQSSGIGLFTAAIAAITITGLTTAAPFELKPLGLIPALLLSIGARSAADTRVLAEEYLGIAQVGDKVRYQYDSSDSDRTPPKPPTPFDWSKLTSQPDRYPHLMILGSTGDGKSTLAEWLLGSWDGLKLAIDPHYAPGNYPGFKVHGAARDYGTKDSPVVDITSANGLDATSALTSLVVEMDRRFKRREAGYKDYANPRIEMLLDEVPALASNVPVWRKVIPALIAEARKVGIRLTVLTQGYQVELLGLEGKSDLRESIRIIRLGTFAVAHAKHLFEKGDLSSSDYQWLKSQERPCMVDGAIAAVPSLTRTKPEETPPSKPSGADYLAWDDEEQLLQAIIPMLDAGIKGEVAMTMLKVEPVRARQLWQTWKMPQDKW